MFDKDYHEIGGVEAADSGLELVDSSTDSNVEPAKVGMWVLAFSSIKYFCDA